MLICFIFYLYTNFAKNAASQYLTITRTATMMTNVSIICFQFFFMPLILQLFFFLKWINKAIIRKAIPNVRKNQLYFPMLNANDTPLSPNMTNKTGPTQQRLAIKPPIIPTVTSLLFSFISFHAQPLQDISCLHNRRRCSSFLLRI